MPTNLYGPNDNYDLQNSHVIPALIKKIYQAKANKEKHVIIWGSGSPKREFLHVDDLARACLFFMENIPAQNIYDQLKVSHINIGTGLDISIKELAKLICSIIGFEGELKFDTKKPDGTPKKLLDTSKANFLGWKPQIILEDGIKDTINEFIKIQG